MASEEISAQARNHDEHNLDRFGLEQSDVSLRLITSS